MAVSSTFYNLRGARVKLKKINSGAKMDSFFIATNGRSWAKLILAAVGEKITAECPNCLRLEVTCGFLVIASFNCGKNGAL